MNTDQSVRLRTVLGDLENGRVSTADAAAIVRTMHFPKPPPSKTVSRRMEDAAGDDAPPRAQPGSFQEVARAYALGRIDLRQYEALADAAAEAMRSDEGKTGDGTDAGSSSRPEPGGAPGLLQE